MNEPSFCGLFWPVHDRSVARNCVLPAMHDGPHLVQDKWYDNSGNLVGREGGAA